MSLHTTSDERSNGQAAGTSSATGAQAGEKAGAQARLGAKEIPLQVRQAMRSRLLSVNFGNMVVVLMQSPAHRDKTLADLQELVVPALLRDQFRIAEVTRQDSGFMAPVALVLWARVSEEVDRRLSAEREGPVRLAPDEWAGGDILWLVETVGEKRFVDAILADLAKTAFKGKTVKFRKLDADGVASVETLDLAGADADGERTATDAGPEATDATVTETADDAQARTKPVPA